MPWDIRQFKIPSLRRWIPAVCVIAFILTGLGVYQRFWLESMGSADGERPKATAAVRIQSLGKVGEGDLRPRLATPAASALKKEITADASLNCVVSRWASPAGPGGEMTVDAALRARVLKLRESLDVVVSEPSGAREILVAISCFDADARLAREAVNSLAGRYADECRTRLQADMERVCTEARNSATRAKTEATAARAALESFLAVYFRNIEAQSRETTSQAAEPRSKVDELPGPSAMVENPQWTALNRELSQQRQRLEQLSATRTALHPEVQRQEEKIADLERHLADLPRQIPQPNSRPTTAESPLAATAAEPTKTGKPSAALGEKPQATPELIQAVETQRHLRDALTQAEEKCERLAQLERSALEGRARLPRVDLVLAEPPTVVSGAENVGLLWVALAAAATMAGGVGLVALGFTADPPFTRLAEIQASLAVPIIGVLSATRMPPEPNTDVAGPRSRFPWLASGALLIAGSIAIVVAGQ